MYKLVEIARGREHGYRLKLSAHKVSYAGAKQVFRFSHTPAGARVPEFERDVVARAEEAYEDAEPLLICVMRKGKRSAASPVLSEVQSYAREQMERLPERVRRLREPEQYRVEFSAELQRLQERERRKHERAV